MRRRKNNAEKLKKYVYIFSITLFISFIIFISLFITYNKRLNESANKELQRLGKESKLLENEDLDNIKETSYSKDATINSISNTVNSNIAVNTNKNSSINTNNKTVKNKSNLENILANETSSNISFSSNSITENNNEINQDISLNDSKNLQNNKVNENLEDVSNGEIVENKTLNFIAPVSGEIIKDFSMDTLVYSNTLKEWTTHSGIDIKADKTSIVVSSESGTVESIKNDPRFGLTITIVHDDGFKTIYSNLLTTEFVKENEVVERGQTIGTVGESASFEVADEPHLHFEIYKDGETVNPTIYLKDI